MRDPGDFIDGSFRRKTIATGIDLITGRLEGGTGSAVAQSYRFDREEFSASEAREWLKDHDIKVLLFEEATGEEKAVLKEFPVKKFAVGVDPAAANEQLWLLAKAWESLDQGQEVKIGDKRANKQQVEQSGANILHSLIDAKVLELDPAGWREETRPFMEHIVGIVQGRGVDVPFRDGTKVLMTQLAPGLFSSGAPFSTPGIEEEDGNKQDEEPTKVVDGVGLHAEDFASVGDPDEPATWKLPLAERAGSVSETRIAAAITALQPGGFRGNPVELTAPKASVIRKISAAIGKLDDEDAQDRLRTRLDDVKEKAKLGGQDSVEQIETQIRRAFDAALSPPLDKLATQTPPYISGPWIVDTYPMHVVCEWGGKFYQVAYTQTTEGFEFAPREEWIEVEKREEWLAKARKAGRRIRGDRLATLREIKQRFEDLLKNVGELVGWGEYADQQEDHEPPWGKPMGAFKAFEGPDGDTWLLTWTTNAFEDRDKEIFSTKAIEEYVGRHEAEPEKGAFQFWHLPGTQFGTIKWQGMSGRFLVEAGPFDDSLVGKAFKAFFQEFPDRHPKYAPEGWGTSHGFIFDPAELEGGVYGEFEKYETSILPAAVAANQHNPRMEVIEVNDKQIKMLRDIGGQDLVDLVVETGETLTKNLEESGVRHKEAGGKAGSFARQVRAVLDGLEKGDSNRKELSDLLAAIEDEEEKGKKSEGEKGLAKLGAKLKTLAEKIGGDVGKKLGTIASAMEKAEEKADEKEAEGKKDGEPEFASFREVAEGFEVLGAAIAGLASQIKTLATAQSAQISKAVEEKLIETPRASLKEIAARSIIGKKEAQETEDLKDKGPEEAEPKPENGAFGVPLLDGIKAANRAYSQKGAAQRQ